MTKRYTFTDIANSTNCLNIPFFLFKFQVGHLDLDINSETQTNADPDQGIGALHKSHFEFFGKVVVSQNVKNNEKLSAV